MTQGAVFFIIFMILFGIGPLAGPSPLRAEAAGISFSEIEARIDQLRDDDKIPGFCLVVVQGERQWVQGFGYADLEKQVPVTPETLFELGSCSKAFTALALLRLTLTSRLAKVRLSLSSAATAAARPPWPSC
jgi:CubicO group peptidase (beta-lactamase class C family)